MTDGSILLWLEPVTHAGAGASLPLLSPEERARVAAIRSPQRARAVSVSLALTRRALAAKTGLAPDAVAFTRRCDRCGHPTHGRPQLASGCPEFSCSRSERWAAVVVARHPVGVDIEDSDRPATPGDISPAFSPSERLWLDAGRSPQELMKLWVLKESVGKAMGLGIIEPEEITVVRSASDDLAGWRSTVDSSDRTWSVTLFDASEAAIAVAVAGDPLPITRVHLPV